MLDKIIFFYLTNTYSVTIIYPLLYYLYLSFDCKHSVGIVSNMDVYKVEYITLGKPRICGETS